MYTIGIHEKRIRSAVMASFGNDYDCLLRQATGDNTGFSRHSRMHEHDNFVFDASSVSTEGNMPVALA